MKNSLTKIKSNFIVTCEHAVSDVPHEAYEILSLSKKLLSTHRGFDAGAKKVSQILAHNLKGALFCSIWSRLVLDFNRSLKFKKTSKATEQLPKTVKNKVISDYQKYRAGIWNSAEKVLKGQRPLYYISVHSFTPVMDGIVRKTDIGLLFRTKNPKEKKWAKRVQKSLKKRLPALRIHLNMPYRGHTDCLMVDLCEDIERNKKSWPKNANENFVPIFLELNQKHIKSFDKIAESFIEVFRELDLEDRHFLE